MNFNNYDNNINKIDSIENRNEIEKEILNNNEKISNPNIFFNLNDSNNNYFLNEENKNFSENLSLKNKELKNKKLCKKYKKKNKNDNINNQIKRVYNKKTGQKIRRWTLEESILYENFIDNHWKDMKYSRSKRNSKAFIQMSDFIKSKSPSQCRSHHQKFFRKFINFRKENHNLSLARLNEEKKKKKNFEKVKKKICKFEEKKKTFQYFFLFLSLFIY